VASHFSDIGFVVASTDDLVAYARALPPDTPADATPFGNYLRWSPGSGAELWFQVDPEHHLVGANPHFDAMTPTRVRLTARETSPTHPLDGGFHLWLDPQPPDPTDGDAEVGATPLFVDVPDFRLHDAVVLPIDVDLKIAAFAHTFESHPTEESFRATGSTMATESLIPSGLFAPGGAVTVPPRAEAILYGHVEAVEVRTNPPSGLEFIWCRVKTYGGRLEIVADRSLAAEPPVVGGIVGGSFWLSARLAASEAGVLPANQ
jgi:hypothetical protein